jgi:hypothetical protein
MTIAERLSQLTLHFVCSNKVCSNRIYTNGVCCNQMYTKIVGSRAVVVGYKVVAVTP